MGALQRLGSLMGRPKGSGSRYTTALGEAICAELSEGKPLRVICRERSLSWVTVYNWRDAHPAFRERLVRARALGEDAIVEECLDIADDTAQDYTETDRGPALDREHIQRSKLRVETRLKLLAIWNPTKFGPKIEQTHKGDASAPIALTLNGSDVQG